MKLVVTEPCKGCKDKSCLKVCPVEAIFYEDDVPVQWFNYIELNAKRSKECPPAQSK